MNESRTQGITKWSLEFWFSISHNVHIEGNTQITDNHTNTDTYIIWMYKNACSICRRRYMLNQPRTGVDLKCWTICWGQPIRNKKRKANLYGEHATNDDATTTTARKSRQTHLKRFAAQPIGFRVRSNSEQHAASWMASLALDNVYILYVYIIDTHHNATDCASLILPRNVGQQLSWNLKEWVTHVYEYTHTPT